MSLQVEVTSSLDYNLFCLHIHIYYVRNSHCRIDDDVSDANKVYGIVVPLFQLLFFSWGWNRQVTILET